MPGNGWSLSTSDGKLLLDVILVQLTPDGDGSFPMPEKPVRCGTYVLKQAGQIDRPILINMTTHETAYFVAR